MHPTLPRLLRGQMRLAELPVQLDLGPLWEGLRDLCIQSLGVDPRQLTGPFPRTDGQREWGACLVANDSGLRLHHPVGGTANAVNPDPQCVPDPHDPLHYGGFAHTHLPDPDHHEPLFGFSPVDYRATLADGDHLALACNGPQVFALVRTEVTRPKEVVSQGVLRRWRDRFVARIDEAQAALQSGSGSSSANGDALTVALWRANRELCEELGFAFYWGRWGEPLALFFQP
jgi:hypothetical protein